MMKPKTQSSSAIRLSRRSILKMLAATPVIIGFGTGALDARADERRRPRFVRPSAERSAAPAATVSGLSTHEAEILNLLVAAIVPADTTPGAHDTGSAAFVLLGVQRRGEATMAEFKQALAGVDNVALSIYAQPFAQLSTAERDQVVGLVATMPAFALFWRTVRTLTVLHFYADPRGYLPLGLPGPNIDRGGYPHAMRHTNRTCVAL